MASEISLMSLIDLLQKSPWQRTDAEIESHIPKLRQISEVFRALDRASMMKLVRMSEVEFYAKNDVLIQQGDTADCCFVILSGNVSVYETKDTSQLKLRARVTSIRQYENGSNKDINSLDETAEDEENSIDPNSNLQTTTPLKNPILRRRRPARASQEEPADGKPSRKVSYIATDRKKSDTEKAVEEAESMLIDKRMSIAHRITLRFSVLEEDEQRGQLGNRLATIGHGTLIGEISLLKRVARAASVVADSKTVVTMKISADLFDSILRPAVDKDLIKKVKLIDTHPIFESWPASERSFLAGIFELRVLNFGEPVVRQGDVFNALHFVVEGEVEVLMDAALHEIDYSRELKECKELTALIKSKLNIIRQGLAFHYHKRIEEDENDLDEEENAAVCNSSQLRNYSVCNMSATSILGDIEAVLNFRKYIQTAICKQRTVVLTLAKRHWERAIKRRPQTAKMMTEFVRTKLAMRLRKKEVATRIPILEYARLKTHQTAQLQRYHDYLHLQIASVPYSLQRYVQRLATAEIQLDYESKSRFSPSDRTDLTVPTDCLREKLGSLAEYAGFDRELRQVGRDLREKLNQLSSGKAKKTSRFESRVTLPRL